MINSAKIVPKTFMYLKIYFLILQDPSIRDGVLCSGMLLYLHHINFKIFFHPSKMRQFQTINPESQIFAGLKTLGLVGL